MAAVNTNNRFSKRFMGGTSLEIELRLGPASLIFDGNNREVTTPIRFLFVDDRRR
jgi:hypothetical protein